jgi:riboflavin transporter
MKYIILWFRMFYGAHLLYSTLRHYFTTFNPNIPGMGGRFVNSLVETGMYEMVKAIEGVVGLCLVLNLFVPLVLAIEMPISVIIFYLNFFIVGTGYQLFTGPQEIFLNGLLMVFYGGSYVSMLKARTAPEPFWQAWGRTRS